MKRKSVSPVVATIILVAVAIVVAVTVSVFMISIIPEEPAWEAPELAYNAKVLIDIDGNAWIYYHNGTHHFYVKIDHDTFNVIP